MAPSDLSSNPSVPSAESLLLSASVFTSSVASWIPANFGHVVPPAEAEKEWQALLRSAGEGKDRLGLGHPLIDAPKPMGGGYRGGLQGLEKSLKNGKRKAGEEEKERGDKEEVKEVDEDEEESRASMVGKRKRPTAFDPLSTGKKKKGGQKGLSTPTTNSAATSARASPAAVEAIITSTPVATSSEPFDPCPTPGESVTPLPQPTLPEVPPTDSAHSAPTGSVPPTSAPTSPVKSKSAKKREKKRLAKLQAAAQAGAQG